MSDDLTRIMALPRRKPDWSTQEDWPILYKNNQCPGCKLCFGGEPKLWPVQLAALREGLETGGLAGPIGVGHGKSLIALLLPAVLRAKKTVLLVKPSLKSQLKREVVNYANHFWIPTKYIRLVSYSELSNADKGEILEKVSPDLIIADECHLLRHPNAARTKRFLRYMKAHQEVKFVGLSGTMTTRSIKDYAHFFDLALKDGSPLPRKETELYAWAEALDDATTKAPAPPGKLKLLCVGDETVRDGFRRRVLDTKGVVSTPESALGTSLSLIAISGVGDEKIAEALAELRRTWTWQGEEFEDALAFHRIAKQLASGFYYRWAWPGGVADKEWLSARAAWHAEVREYLLDNSTPGMDSPLLLARAAQAGLWQSYTWDSWSRLRDRTPPPVEAVWISEAVVNSALHWAKNNEGIIWYEHDAVGRKIAEIGKLPFFGPGEKAAVLLDSAHPTIMPNIVCSIRAHGTGKNLQAYSKMYVTSPPSNGQIWEQLIGRMHRPGQQADEVEVYIVSHTKEQVSALKQARKDALYVEQTQGQKQKLLYGDYVGWDDVKPI